MLRNRLLSEHVVLGVVVVSVLAATAWLGYRMLEREHRARLETTLVSLVEIRRQAALDGVVREKDIATLRATAIEGKRFVDDLRRSRRGVDGGQDWPSLGQVLEHAGSLAGRADFAVVDRDGVTRFSSSGEGIGQAHPLLALPGALDSLWAGRAYVSAPIVEGAGLAVTGRGVMFAATPIRGPAGGSIAALAFHLDPLLVFPILFNRDRMDSYMEPFAFDRNGHVLRGSRAGVAGQSVGTAAMSKLATAAVAGSAAVESRGYRNEIGVEVVGAWVWDNSLGFGIAIELDARQAHAPLKSEAWRLAGLIVLAMALVLGVLVQSNFQQVRAIIAGAPVGMLVTDASGAIRQVNPAACALLGYAEPELLGRSVEQLVPDSLRHGHAPLREAYQRAPHTRVMGMGADLSARRHDGSVVHLEVALTPIRLGGRPHTLAMLTDMTRRRAAEALLRERTEELVRSNTDLEQFAYVASHDLRAPLRGIVQLAQWLAEDLSPDASGESRQHLELLRGRVARMDALLNSLLEYARASRGARPVERVDLERTLRNIADLQDWPPGFALRLAGPFPTFETDATGLQQVLMNLLGNAIKHHDRGEGVIEVGARVVGDVREFYVADDGPGIPVPLQGKAFEMFQTLKPRDEVEGSGMGLALVRRIVQLRGGTVAIEPHAPRGTTIRFTWPDRPGKGATS